MIERLGREAAPPSLLNRPTQPTQSCVFDGLATAWKLNERERLSLLGLTDAPELKELRGFGARDLPTESIERVVILLDLFEAINTLLPHPARADSWGRSPNGASISKGDRRWSL